MAIGDIGMFLPRESHYQTPGAFNKMLQAEAMKRANYLAQMDQFYENLTEAQRQFNEQLSFNVETRDLELAWERERMEEELKFRREELAAEEEYREGMLGLEERRVEIAESQAGVGEGSELDFLERRRLWQLIEREQDIREREAETEAEAGRPTRPDVAPGSGWEGPGVTRPEFRPGGTKESGRVDVPGGGMIPPGIWTKPPSAADIPGGRRVTDRPEDLPSLWSPEEEYGP